MLIEKRRFSRIPFKVNAELKVNNTIYSAEEISNLSIGGCLFPVAADLESGAVCHVRILLSGRSNERSIMVEGTVARSTGGTVAIKFTRIDPENLFHLQNIIRYNAPDSEEIEKEIRDHPGLL